MGGSAIKDSKRMDLIDYNLLKITIESSFNKFKNESRFRQLHKSNKVKI